MTKTAKWEAMELEISIRKEMRCALHNDDCHDDNSPHEINLTALAETVAHALGHDEWLDDETHIVWDLAVDVTEAWRRRQA